MPGLLVRISSATIVPMMRKPFGKFALIWLGTGIAATAQVVSVSRLPMQQFDPIPPDEAIERAMETSSLTYHGAPFLAVMTISKPSEKNSPYEGTVEAYWADATHYRVTVNSRSFQQTRIVNGDAVEEQDVGDFYPGWLRNYALALLDPLHRAPLLRERTGFVAVGEGQMRSCLSRDDRPGGITDQMTWASIWCVLPGFQHSISHSIPASQASGPASGL